MAGIALEWLMRTVQCMTCRGFVVEAGIFPGSARVAGAAIIAEMTLVIVVFEVATDAGGIEFVRKRVFAVTVATGELSVLAVEYELRVASMVETGVGPAGRRMTVAALLAAAAIMRIVVCVTAETGRCRILIGLVFVAAAALGFPVLANQ